MFSLSLNMKFWDDGQPDSTRIRNVNYSWNELKKFTQFLKNNGSGNFVDVTDSTVVGYNTSMPVSYNPRFVDLNGDGLLDILLPQQAFGSSNGTQLLLRTPDGQYIAAFTQIFNDLDFYCFSITTKSSFKALETYSASWASIY
jgi:hypothetical protein